MNMKKTLNRGGINRAAAVLLMLIGVMLVLIAVPGYRRYRYRAQKTACEQAMKSARDGLTIEFLSRFEKGSVENAMKTLDEVLPERANICPSGGTVYLIRNAQGIFEPVCGMHDSDLKLRVRLNATRARELLSEELKKAGDAGDEAPESLEITLNGKALVCERVDEVLTLRRGTATTSGYEGIVAFYGLEGEGGFSTGKVADGELCYFVYADENHAAVWRADDGWTGDAYQNVSTSP